jgi:hypothetical protein
MHADQRVRHLLHLAVDPTEADWTAFRLPPALFWLYIPSRAARLFGKYALGMGKRRVVNGSLN